MSRVSTVSVEILEAGACIGNLQIADENGKSSIDPQEAEDSGALVQLLEDHAYEFAFTPSEGIASVWPVFAAPFIPSRLATNGLTGRLPSSRFVGTVDLSFAKAGAGKPISVAIEVRPRKLDYLTEFYEMLNDLSAVALDLVTTLRSSFSTTLRTDETHRSESIQQQLMFLKSICESQQIFSALNRIQSLPRTTLMRSSSSAPISRSIAQSRRLVDSFSRQADRARLPDSHPLAKCMRTVPRSISVETSHETLDTVENRFVKFVIRSLSDFVTHAMNALNTTKGADKSLIRWLEAASRSFREMYSHSFFKGIGDIHVLPLGSPSLQRRHGYKQVLDVWLRFNSANQLSWNALDEVFAGGQRDAALLYNIGASLCSERR